MLERSAATTEKVLKGHENSAHNEDNQQMTSAQRAQTFALNPKIVNSITEAESKDRKRNSNENYQLFRQRNDRFDPERVGPSTR